MQNNYVTKLYGGIYKMQNTYELRNFELEAAEKIDEFLKENSSELIFESITDLRDFLMRILGSSNLYFTLENINRVQSMLMCELNGSYVQQSQIYAKVDNKENSYHFEDLISLSPKHKIMAEELIEEAIDLYKKMSELKEESKNKSRTTKEDYKYGIPIEDARYILPTIMNTNMSVSFNGEKLIEMVDYTFKNSNNMINLKPILDDIVLSLPKSIRDLIDEYIVQAHRFSNDTTDASKLVEKYYDEIINSFSCENEPSHLNNERVGKEDLIKVALGAATSTSNKTPSEKLEEWRDQSDVVPVNMKAQNLVSNVLGYGHDSISEQARVSFVLNMSLVAYHQFIRHRLSVNKRQPLNDIFSFEGEDFYIPETIKDSIFIHDYKIITNKFKKFRKELSKYSYPDPSSLFLLNNSMIKVYNETNYRIEKDIMNERLCLNAHNEIRNLYLSKLKKLNNLEPTIMEDARPDCMLDHGCQEGNLSCGNSKYIKQKINEIIV